MQDNKIEKTNKIKQIFQFAKNDEKRQQAKREKLVKKIERLEEKCQKVEEKRDYAFEKHADFDHIACKRLDGLGEDFFGALAMGAIASLFVAGGCALAKVPDEFGSYIMLGTAGAIPALGIGGVVVPALASDAYWVKAKAEDVLLKVENRKLEKAKEKCEKFEMIR